MALGVDLIETDKAKAFYDEHRTRLGTYFSAREIRFIGRGPSAWKRLAALLASKEAVFKAEGVPAGGLSVFRDIRLSPIGRGRFASSLASHRKPRRGPDVSCRNYKHYVVARCAGTS